MRNFLEILRFELRLQARSPLFTGMAAVFFLIHLCTIAGVGIHIGDNALVDLNGAHRIFLTQVVLSVFGMLPAIVFVVQGATRDRDARTLELILTTPVTKGPWLLGRFGAGLTLALCVGLAGLLGTLVGTLLPTLEPERLGPFSWQPYALAFLVIDLPNLFVFCSLFFGLAALSGSVALSVAGALAVLVLELTVHNFVTGPVPTWALLADPFGGLALSEVSRFWSVAELNGRIPISGALLTNRVAWSCLALLALGGTLRICSPEACRSLGRIRIPGRTRPPKSPRSPSLGPSPESGGQDGRGAPPSFGRVLAAQLHMDLRAVLRSPLVWLVLGLVMVGTRSEFLALRDPILDLPLHPQTGLLLDFFREGLLQFVLLVVLYQSAVVVHGEREAGLHEILDASPRPDWVAPVSGILTVLLLVGAVLLVSMMTSVGLQLRAGHTELEPGLYLESLLAFNGFQFGMFCVLAVLLQALSRGRWSGMTLVFASMVALLGQHALGLEHLVHGFRIPPVLHSDLNGFGHYRLPAYALIGHWGVFSVFMVILTCLVWPKGTLSGPRERLLLARGRWSPRLARMTGAALVAFAGTSTFILYHTTILNDYETRASRLDRAADYERQYSDYRDRPGPSLLSVDMELDLFPEERRLLSRGRASLVNRTDRPIEDFVVSTDPRLRVTFLEVQGGRPVLEDAVHGFAVYGLHAALPPGGTLTIHWEATRENRGFVNSGADDELVANGTFVELRAVMPFPAYDEDREIDEAPERRSRGLPPRVGLPALGDTTFLHTLGHGVDGRMAFRVVLSTSAGQTGVAPGVLRRRWQEGGRNHFEYVMETPIWPSAAFLSGRYEVARAGWGGVEIEVYHDASHGSNVATMLETARTGLDFFSRTFGPYPLSHFRLVEYPRYRSAVQAFPGTIAYAEGGGFLTDLSEWVALDYATLHELAHHWWGGQLYGAKMQGRQILNEGLAQYSTFMVYRELDDPRWLRRILARTHDAYLTARGVDPVPEQPVVRSEDQGHISYNKAPLALFALQDLIGSEPVHAALRNLLDRFAGRPPPFPTSLDLVAELRAVAGPEHQQLIGDLFERIVLTDLGIGVASARPVEGGYEVRLELTGRQFEADSHGVETEVPLDSWFDVALFPRARGSHLDLEPLYLEKHRLRTGTTRLTVRVAEEPGRAGIDPFFLRIDRVRDNNVVAIAFDELPAENP